MFARKISLLLLALVASLGLAACGGDEGASSDMNVSELLERTFTGEKKIDSGRVDLTLAVDAKGAEGLSGPISLKLSGPFQSEGKGKLPTFDMDLTFQGAGQNLTAGLTSTGEKGFVNFNGTEYVVDDQVFAEFKKGFEQASTEGEKDDQSLASLGIDPRKWLENPANAGEAKVGDTDTIKITGDVNVPALLDDVNNALAKARSLGIEGTEAVPSKLSDEQRKQIEDAVKELKVEIYTGKDDFILRRMVVALGIEPSDAGEAGFQSADIDFDIQLLELNEGQEIAEPENAKPFEELLQNLGPLFGGLGGGAIPGAGGGSAPGASGGSAPPSGGDADEKLKEYSDCISAAGSDVEAARKCADLLTG